MNAIAPYVLQLVWVVWLPATVAVAVGALRARLPEPGAARRALLGLLGVGAAAAVLACLLPFRVDASGVMELTGLHHSPTPWKGAAAKALVSLISVGGTPGYFALIAVTRASVALAPLLLYALVVRVHRGRAALQAAVVLGLSPLFLHSVLGSFNFWFFPLLALGLLLAVEVVEERPTLAARLSLVTGIVLIAFSRPETMVVGGLLGLGFFWRAARRRDRLDAVLLGLALLLFAWSVAELADFLLDRMRNQPLLMGSDAARAAPPTKLAVTAVRRVFLHLPRDVLLLLVTLHGLLLLAAARLWRLLRTRRASAAEVAAAVLLLTEFTAIALHREGFFKLTKYGMLVAVPVWYLAVASRLPLLAEAARRRWLRALTILAVVIGAGYTAADWTGWGAPHGWQVPGRADPLLWRETPRLAEELCPARGGGPPAAVLVLGLDERRAAGVGIPWLGIEAAEWESDIWPLPRVLRQAGCGTISRYPPRDLPLRTVLGPAGGGLLCAPLPLDEGRGARAQPGAAIVTYLEAGRRAELRAALAQSACPWRLERDLGHAALLRRVGPLPPPAAGGSGTQPATEAGHGPRQGRE